MNEFLNGKKYLRLTVDDISYLDKLASLGVTFVSGDTLYGSYIKRKIENYHVIYLWNSPIGVTVRHFECFPPEAMVVNMFDIVTDALDITENELMEILNNE